MPADVDGAPVPSSERPSGSAQRIERAERSRQPTTTERRRRAPAFWRGVQTPSWPAPHAAPRTWFQRPRRRPRQVTGQLPRSTSNNQREWPRPNGAPPHKSRCCRSYSYPDPEPAKVLPSTSPRTASLDANAAISLELTPGLEPLRGSPRHASGRILTDPGTRTDPRTRMGLFGDIHPSRSASSTPAGNPSGPSIRVRPSKGSIAPADRDSGPKEPSPSLCRSMSKSTARANASPKPRASATSQPAPAPQR